MKVRELRALLADLPDDAVVLTESRDTGALLLLPKRHVRAPVDVYDGDDGYWIADRAPAVPGVPKRTAVIIDV